jgi:hypothetical protein
LKLQKKCIPAAEKMLRDKALRPERIQVYGHLLKQAANSLRIQCIGAIEQLRNYPMMLERFAHHIENLKPDDLKNTSAKAKAVSIWTDLRP